MSTEGTATPAEGRGSAEAEELRETPGPGEARSAEQPLRKRAAVGVAAIHPVSNLCLVFLFQNMGRCAGSREACLSHASEFLFIPPVAQLGKLRLPRPHSP